MGRKPENLERKWRKSAEKVRVTNRNFLEQMEDLHLNQDSFKGKTVLVLGPGERFEFERGIAREGAESVVVLAHSYKEHASPEQILLDYPNVHLVEGLFQQLPPAYDSFDLIVSDWGYPMYIFPHDEAFDKRAAIIRENYRHVIDLLAPGGEARLYPVFQTEVSILQKLQEDHSDEFSVEIQPHHIHMTDVLVIIRKHKAHE